MNSLFVMSIHLQAVPPNTNTTPCCQLAYREVHPSYNSPALSPCKSLRPMARSAFINGGAWGPRHYGHSAAIAWVPIRFTSQLLLAAGRCQISTVKKKMVKSRWPSDKKRPIWDISVPRRSRSILAGTTPNFNSAAATTHSHVMKDHGRAGYHARR